MSNMNTLKGPDASRIHSMFEAIANRYDLGNSVLSLGIHHLWRRELVRWSHARPGDSILDCATGTGDLALAFKKKLGKESRVVGTDFSAQMLLPAPAKAKAAGLDVQFLQADVKKLPFLDREFQVASISFGIRNVENPIEGIQDMARTLSPGGRLMILEFGQPTLPVWKQFYQLYSQKILPRVGGWVTGNPDAYRYLQTSSAGFPCGEAFCDWLRSTGLFSKVEYRSLSGGIAYLYRATK